MVLRHHYSFFFPLFIAIIICRRTTSVSGQQDRRLQDCRRQSQCGDFSIGYPFWGIDRPSYCGLPEFHLICVDQTPTIDISGINYRVLRVDASSRVLTLTRTDYQPTICPAGPPRNTTTAGSSLFPFSDDTQFVTLHYGCSFRGAQIPASLMLVNCSRLNRNSGNYFVTRADMHMLMGGSSDAAARSLLETCSTRVTIPVNRTALAGSGISKAGFRFRAAIDRGFGVRWTADRFCDACTSSGGECGFDGTTSSSVCYCSDRAYGFQCDTQQNRRRRRLPLKILLPIVASTTLFAVALTYLRNRVSNKQNKGQSSNGPAGTKSSRFPAQFGGSREPPTLQAFSFSDVRAATNNFSGENLLGSGGFGPVYKGVLPEGELIAVKRLSKSSTQGLLEFTNEVSLTARLQHVNLVRVVGFCTENEEKMLIYEFMQSRSLDIYLFDPVKKLSLDWNARVRIIEGVTQGLLYLQEYSNFTIIHRDLKASNILLDDGMNPKISDFGMAKLFRKDLCEANTNRIVGTYGYVPPEYVKNGIYSMKYDVYSFGVLLLQMISSKRSQRYYGPNEDMHLLDHAYDSWRRGEGMEFCDPSLDDSSSQCKLMTCLQMALLCVQEYPDDRPTMLEVSSILRKGALGMATPKKPAFSVRKESIVITNSQFRQEIYSYNGDDISQVEPR